MDVKMVELSRPMPRDTTPSIFHPGEHAPLDTEFVMRYAIQWSYLRSRRTCRCCAARPYVQHGTGSWTDADLDAELTRSPAPHRWLEGVM